MTLSDMTAPSEKDVCLRRIARELDRFVIVLVELELSSSELIQAVPGELPKDALRGLQKLDYLSQCSSALSGLLTRLASDDDIDVEELLQLTRPADLADRLRDLGLEDIDNRGKQAMVF